MDIALFLSLITPMLVVIFGTFVAKEWRLYRKETTELKLMEMENARKRDSIQNVHVETKSENEFQGNAGYVVHEIDEEHKRMFQEVLLGFEEYAELKGYSVNVSIDSSMEGKVAYKITINDVGVTKSSASVQNDLEQYIHEIQSGESRFSGIPNVISQEDHHRIVFALQSRIQFVEQNYRFEREVRHVLQNMLESNKSLGISHQQPTLSIFNGNLDMDKRKYNAENSVGVTQGDKSESKVLESNISIGSSFSETSTIISKLESLLESIDGVPEYEEASRCIKNIKEELEESEKPDSSRIKGWLTKAKKYFSLAEEGGEVLKKANDAYEAFGDVLT